MVRFKNRWLLIEFIPCQREGSVNTLSQAQELNAKLVWLALKQSVIDNFGDIGWGTLSTSLNVKYFSPITNLCIIRVARDNYRLAWGSVTLLTKVDGKYYVPHVVHLAGTIKQAQLAAIKHDREMIARLRARAPERVVASTWGSYDDYLVQSQREIEALQD